MLVAWNNDFALGYDVIDSGHRLVIEAINRLNQAPAGERGATVGRMLPVLRDHLARQFEHESGLMTVGRWTDQAEHEAEHLRLLHVLAVIDESHRAGREMSAALLLNLVCFLATHLRGTDIETFADQRQPKAA